MMLAVDDLWVRLKPSLGGHPIVRGVSFRLQPGDRIAIVGESGSGKSTVALALLGLLPRDVMKQTGRLALDGQDVSDAGEDDWHEIRGRKVAMVFQDPAGALNPVLTVGEQLVEVYRAHDDRPRGEQRRLALQQLAAMGFAEPDRVMRLYPHQMSGGMKQRAVIAMATALHPRLIVADEPTTALDPSIRAQILALLVQKSEADRSSMVLVTHDLAETVRVAQLIAVFYHGRMVEIGPAERVLARPRHPYTQALLNARPRPGQRAGALPVIPGRPPLPSERFAGCAFAPRCPRASESCHATLPELTEVEPNHAHACHSPL
jgi:oligopeptide/dipeptide ABC transporter ATP-binding protein